MIRPFREADFFAKLGQLVPAGLTQRGRDALGADVALAELFLVHSHKGWGRLMSRGLVYPARRDARWHEHLA